MCVSWSVCYLMALYQLQMLFSWLHDEVITMYTELKQTWGMAHFKIVFTTQWLSSHKILPSRPLVFQSWLLNEIKNTRKTTFGFESSTGSKSLWSTELKGTYHWLSETEWLPSGTLVELSLPLQESHSMVEHVQYSSPTSYLAALNDVLTHSKAAWMLCLIPAN